MIDTKKAQIQSLVRKQIASALEDDLRGNELLMKEVWEQCDTSDDKDAAKEALEEILYQIQRHDAVSVPSREETTSRSVASFATYPLDALLDELVTCTVRYNVGDLHADERRIATALLERLASLGIAYKDHRAGCEIWPEFRLCKCPWRVPS